MGNFADSMPDNLRWMLPAVRLTLLPSPPAHGLEVDSSGPVWLRRNMDASNIVRDHLPHSRPGDRDYDQPAGLAVLWNEIENPGEPVSEIKREAAKRPRRQTRRSEIVDDAARLIRRKIEFSGTRARRRAHLRRRRTLRARTASPSARSADHPADR